MNENPYKRLAERLDALPNGFPPSQDGAELRVLAKIFTPEEAGLAAELRLALEMPSQIASRLSQKSESVIDVQALQAQLKGMARKGLIAAGRVPDGLGFGLMPFVVGIYEMQVGRMDAELARLFEDYYFKAFGQALTIKPAIHRVIPVVESVRRDMEIQPFESASEIVANAKAWGVLPCLCRVQKSLIGEPCQHPIDICMVLGQKPGMFDSNSVIRAVTLEEAQATLHRAALAGLVHSVSNSQEGISYICNCCTCACGILRGMADLGIANVIARSSFVNQVDEALCMGCEDCLDRCQFKALTMQDSLLVHVDQARCVGCGICVPACPEGALGLIHRPAEEILAIPATEHDWRMQRANARQLDLNQVL